MVLHIHLQTENHQQKVNTSLIIFVIFGIFLLLMANNLFFSTQDQVHQNIC